MSSDDYTPPVGFVTQQEAADRLGCNVVTIRRLVKAGRLETYTDLRNQRVRLLRVEDVEALMQPILTSALSAPKQTA